MNRAVSPTVYFLTSVLLIVGLVVITVFGHPDADTRGLLLNVISGLATGTFVGAIVQQKHTETTETLGEVRKDLNGRLDARINAAAAAAVLAKHVEEHPEVLK